MTHDELEEAVPLYAAGALDRVERQALEAHLLSGCQSCRTALKDYQSVASLLPFGLSPTQAPRALKSKVMAARNPDPIAIDNLLKESGRPSLEPGEWMNHLFPAHRSRPVALAAVGSREWQAFSSFRWPAMSSGPIRRACRTMP
jgi:hypothetical protein